MAEGEIIIAKVYAFPADGLEEVECLAVVDVLCRSGMEVILVFVTRDRKVTGSHRIELGTDAPFDDADPGVADVLSLPRGMPGTNNLKAYKDLRATVRCANKQGRRIAVIYAASSVLGSMGLLKGRMTTCYPGFEGQLTGVSYTSQNVVTDDNIITGRSLGFALDMGLEPIRLLQGPQQAQRTAATIQYSWKQYSDEKNSCSILYHMDVGWNGSFFCKKCWYF